MHLVEMLGYLPGQTLVMSPHFSQLRQDKLRLHVPASGIYLQPNGFLLRNKDEGGKSREGKANVSKNIKLSDETELTWRLVEGI